jgi:proline racemase
MATLHARDELRAGDEFRHEGILGTVFTGRAEEETAVGEYRAIVPSITGQAWITGFSRFIVDPTDPFPDGFTVGDIW